MGAFSNIKARIVALVEAAYAGAPSRKNAYARITYGDDSLNTTVNLDNADYRVGMGWSPKDSSEYQDAGGAASFASYYAEYLHRLKTSGSDPGVNDDNSELFDLGSLWINTTTDTGFLCVDNTNGAAVWVQVSGGGGSTSHPSLTSLGWTASGHTGGASTLAGFSGAGAATTYALPLLVSFGGTGATTDSGARANLSAAPSGAGYVLTATHPELPGGSVLDVDPASLLSISVGGGNVLLGLSLPNQRVAARDTAGTGQAEAVTITQILDWITSTRGALLFRGAAAWLGLAPGTANYILKSNGAGADPSWVDGGSYFAGLLLAPKVGTVTKTRMWSQVSASGSGSAAFVGGTAIFVLHFDPFGTTYDAIETRVITTAGTSKYRAAVYTHGSDGQPDVLLWTGDEIDSGTTGTTGTKTQLFASNGVWVASPGSYKDGSNRLRLERGQSVWVVYNCQGTAAIRNVALGACRALAHDPANGNPVTGLQATLAYTTPASSFPADTSALTFADRTAELPFLGLREV